MIINNKKLITDFACSIIPLCSDKIIIADSHWLRLRGLTLRDQNICILMSNCCDVHTFTIKRKIDIYFMDENFRVLQKIRKAKSCWRYKNKNASYVLEKFSDSN